jgi:hypothetical protein
VLASLCGTPQLNRSRGLAAYFPICTKLPAGAIGLGLSDCGSRQLSNIPTCCTQDTVQRGPQDFSVKYSRRRISGVY